MGRIFTSAKRPAPECLGFLFLGVEEPVKMYCATSPVRSTSYRTASQISGMSCHSSIRRGRGPFRARFGSLSIRGIDLSFGSWSSMKDFANSFAVRVFPHHLQPTTLTAPKLSSFSRSSLSIKRGI